MRKFIFVALFLILLYTRFGGLDWGFPYAMHPDERNMAVAIEQLNCNWKSQISNLNLTECFNPHFFAYGQLPLYLAYGGIQIDHLIFGQLGQPTFLEATSALRSISAISSLALVFVLFNIVKLLFPFKKTRSFQTFELITLLFFIFQPYAIQFAHFGTTESLLMLFYSLIVYYSLKIFINKTISLSSLILLGVFSGLALGTKISSLIFLGVPILILFIRFIAGGKIEGRPPRAEKVPASRHMAAFEHWWEAVNFDGICNFTISLLTYLSITLFFFILSSPQNFLNWSAFIDSMNYESAVGLGTYVAFYTRQFIGTTPILFQFQKILPYVLGWPTLIGSILGFFLLPSYVKNIIILQVAKLKGAHHARKKCPPAGIWQLLSTGGKRSILTESAKYIDILRFALIISFIPPSFFFAKWTRFIAPSFPLFSLFALLFLYQIAHIKNFPKWIMFCAFILSTFPGVAFLSIYSSPDIRFTASDWIYKNIPENSNILSETANVIDIPVPPPNSSTHIKNFVVNSFNFYDLDEVEELQISLSRALNKADYIIIPSRRIFKNHAKKMYPIVSSYYESLFSGASGFEKVAEFSSYPKIAILGKTLFELPDEEAEETWTVFDHPVIQIYKRITNTGLKNNLDFSQYQTINYQLPTIHSRLLLADTETKWERGLMYVEKKEDIEGKDGMIFQFSDSQTRMFWNKNTLSHLTLYWIQNGKIVGTSDLPSITESKNIVTVTSPSPVDTVIEIIK